MSEIANDIYEPDRKKRLSIDWAKVHIRGDRSEPIHLSDRPTRRVTSPIRWERTR
jgi:hypothetical protein